MQIRKIMIVESPIHLWRLLRTKEEIIDTAREDVAPALILFMDSVSAYLNGCKCDEDENYEDMSNRFAAIKERNVLDHLIAGFECDGIDFKK